MDPVPREARPFLINTFQPDEKGKRWSVLTQSQEIAIRNKRIFIAAMVALVWAAAGVSFYFLATTASEHSSNAIFIPVIAGPLVFGSLIIFASRLSDREPKENLPKFDRPGASQEMIHFLGQEISVLRPHLKSHGEVAPLVRNGLLLPQHGEALVKCIDAFDSKTEDQSNEWIRYQGEIQAQYRKPYTLEQIYREKVKKRKISESFFKKLGPIAEKFRPLMISYMDNKETVEGFESCTEDFKKQLAYEPSYTTALEMIAPDGPLETEWAKLLKTLNS